jgi:hypothetical protein
LKKQHGFERRWLHVARIVRLEAELPNFGDQTSIRLERCRLELVDLADEVVARMEPFDE